MRIKTLWLLLFCFSLVLPVAPLRAEPSFPFNDVQQLTQQDLLVQKYKLQRLRIKELKNHWLIMRGINDKVDDMTLLKMIGKTDVLDKVEENQTFGNTLTLSGLGLMAVGGLLASNLIKFDGAIWVGIAGLIGGGALAISGEMMAGNIGDEFSHILDRQQAERYVAEYNEELKKKLGIAHIPNLD
ncbi:hypothetical protein COW36_03340 [bacterium (Candidatus Blackallbacteria) CG17_big_fil_post_rev_8_21_14_2_50_48_46]|uniref:Glycine zipper family protein n=1 Tax=bacterium (Candidatus Blackallbacteria) CG17_big_fil_post_rev_8_21_14_2_50_48_46 TaxID=2014261 RepID=A0A2M7G9M4_9BACT|nr:MAG: hypothetical protein COW64_05580 [bacterium (Candidatus Blackallbacteria) CG18_big_fil_WC_8_21_14_2_50_49_26]PIW18824.1 MAG: hypothetical protein COW36_03340 [bacterium (Candidatus Blackallbacteria) CG17_big_fil_post_rev_8_21_14_2_50_48_46]PIW49279.1 MAG: hypothetical protein COW20_06490 [bacterium (Candidatus Blackallbacteria) CG13_big_fil_rev_8_21_14_2_50_49_14]